MTVGIEAAGAVAMSNYKTFILLPVVLLCYYFPMVLRTPVRTRITKYRYENILFLFKKKRRETFLINGNDGVSKFQKLKSSLTTIRHDLSWPGFDNLQSSAIFKQYLGPNKPGLNSKIYYQFHNPPQVFSSSGCKSNPVLTFNLKDFERE